MDPVKVDLTTLDRAQLLKICYALRNRCDSLDGEVKRLVRKLQNLPQPVVGNPLLQLPKEERPEEYMRGHPPAVATEGPAPNELGPEVLGSDEPETASVEEDLDGNDDKAEVQEEAPKLPKDAKPSASHARGAKHGRRR